MALNLSIKNVPEALAEKLRRRAEANHRSLQGELMAIIESSTDTHGVMMTKRVGETGVTPVGASAEKLSLREIAERMRARFPTPVAMPAGMSAAEEIRQMRDGRNDHDANQWHDANHHVKGF